MNASRHITFLCIRHGETKANEEKRLQGHYECPLNDLGRLQAQAAGRRLAEVTFDACYASSLSRALQTAELIRTENKGNPPPVQPLDRLREWCFGQLDGRFQKEVRAEYPEILESLYKDMDAFPPGGESRNEFHLRIQGCMNNLAAKHRAGEQILVVTHGGALQAILKLATGDFPQSSLLPIADNAAINEFHFFPERQAWRMVRWNSTDHLAGLPVRCPFVPQ